MSRWETVLIVLTLKSAVKDESKGHFSPIIEMFDLGIRVSNDEASKKKEKDHWHCDAILLLRPESSGFLFLVQITADLPGITKLKKKLVLK